MPTPEQPDVLAKIVEKVQTLLPSSKVYDHTIYPPHDRDEEFDKYFNGPDGYVDVVFINWIGAQKPETTEMDDIVSWTWVYQIMPHRGFVSDMETQLGLDNKIPSRIAFNNDYVTKIINALNADKTLGLGAGCSHDGAYTAQQIGEGILNGRLCSITDIRLNVLIQPCD
jgi:hypothetical protein